MCSPKKKIKQSNKATHAVHQKYQRGDRMIKQRNITTLRNLSQNGIPIESCFTRRLLETHTVTVYQLPTAIKLPKIKRKDLFLT